jgi:pimeloyl-ACP methyl ester carboxylesterase
LGEEVPSCAFIVSSRDTDHATRSAALTCALGGYGARPSKSEFVFVSDRGARTTCGMAEAVASIVDYVEENDLSDVVLVGRSYGGMIITGVADRVAERIRWLVYWNAFVPRNGESITDMLPSEHGALFE